MSVLYSRVLKNLLLIEEVLQMPLPWIILVVVSQGGQVM